MVVLCEAGEGPGLAPDSSIHNWARDAAAGGLRPERWKQQQPLPPEPEQDKDS